MVDERPRGSGHVGDARGGGGGVEGDRITMFFDRRLLVCFTGIAALPRVSTQARALSKDVRSSIGDEAAADSLAVSAGQPRAVLRHAVALVAAARCSLREETSVGVAREGAGT